MYERFTDRARRVLVLAQEEGRLLSHGHIGTEHLLLGLMDERDGVAAQTLDALGLSLEDVRDKVEELVHSPSQPVLGSPPFTPRAKKVLELSLREALELKHNDIGTEHILLGLLREGHGVGAQVLVQLGVDVLRVRRDLMQTLAGFERAAPSTRSVMESVASSRPFGSSMRRTGAPPYCPRCDQSLVDGLRFTNLVDVNEGDASTIPVAIISCRSCDVTLGTAAPPAS